MYLIGNLFELFRGIFSEILFPVPHTSPESDYNMKKIRPQLQLHSIVHSHTNTVGQ